MKSLIVAAALLLSPQALAAELTSSEAIEELQNHSMMCTNQEDHDGTAISSEKALESCKILVLAIYKLSESGFCHVEADNSWRKCQ